VLFNSYPFLFLFFPLTLAAYWLAHRCGRRAQQLVLLAASLGFYGSWNVRFLPLLIGSILVNHTIGNAISASVRRHSQRTASVLLGLGVAANLATIGVFKYADFFVNNVDFLFRTDFVLGAIILPLGISFFTFEQISFLVDVRRGNAHPSDLLRYAVFVSFFPRVVAGPILRFREIIPQLEERGRWAAIGENLMVGLSIFAIGLVKKTVLADGIAPYVSPAFHSAAAGSPLDFFAAWSAALAYTCQLYFDFSGYSDMAIGAARCFGIRFPMNFFSPYKATSIIEFWRRWHITLSRFLRDYLYIGLGGNRRGTTRRYANLMITMLLGGLWHGANWTFVIWGGLHGCYLMINHAWLAVSAKSQGMERFRRSRAGRGMGWALTFLAVVVGWVFFRAPSLGVAGRILGGMIGRNGFVLPAGLAYSLRAVHGLISVLDIRFNIAESGSDFVKAWLWIGALLSIAWLMPNTQQLMRNYDPVLDLPKSPDEHRRPLLPFRWVPSPGWAIAVGALAFLGTISITRVSAFLYWQF
jgi:alginate O-acetyltransferase complex protein AlgI